LICRAGLIGLISSPDPLWIELPRNCSQTIFQNAKEYVSIKKCKRTTVQYIIQSPIVLRRPPLRLVTVPYEKKSPTTKKTRKDTTVTTPSVQDTVDGFQG
jgi:hypothetical protein